MSTPSVGASSGPFSPTVVTVHQEPIVICRANGGSLNPNAEADQNLGFSLTYPQDIHAGDTFNIKIRPDALLVPRSQASGNSLLPKATVYNIWGEVSGYQLPAGLTINSVSLAPINGNVEANPDAGYYVNQANIPAYTDPLDSNNVGAPPDYDPLVSNTPAQRLPIPGIAPNAFWNTSTNRVYESMLGTNTAGSNATNQQYAAGSAVQGPTVTVNVTATASIGSHLNVTLAGQVPGGTGANFLGAQPDNFTAPSSSATNTSTPAVAPWFSTDGNRYVYSNPGVWTDPSFTLVVTVNALLTISARAACGPGWEPNTSLGTSPPSYYAGPTALPNGTSPPLSDTVVVPYIQANAPAEGAKYVTGQSLNADYKCWASISEQYDSCVGDLANGASVDTSTPGAKTFTINGTDANNGPLSKVVHYTVADPLPPVANAGANQTGKVAANVVTLDGSASSDPNGIPALALSYTDATGLHPTGPNTFTWSQVSNGAPTVTLSDVHAIKPTFTVPPVDSPSGNTFQFNLKVDNTYLNNTASTTVTSVASTPTVTVAKSRPGGGSTFYEGDLITLTPTITNPDGNNPADYSYVWSLNTGISTPLSSTTVANPTFTIPPNGTAACTSGATATNCPTFKVIVTKTNTGKSSASAALAAYGSTLPTTPVANAGPAQNVANAGGVVTLDGSASAQAQGHTISYQWSQTGGPAGLISDPTAQKPTFTAPAAGPSGATYTLSLVVTDTQNVLTTGGNTRTSTAATTTVNQVVDHVVANAGPNQTGKIAGNVVTLDGSASTSPSNTALNYSWSQVSNGAPTVTLSSSSAQKPTFTAPAAVAPAGYVAAFNLTVNNADGSDTTATPVTITVAASTPTVAAPTKVREGGGSTFFTGDKVTLSVAITNPDGTAEGDYSYAWVFSTGVSTALTGANTAHPTYIIPPQTNGTTACVSGTGATGCPEFKVTVTKTNTGKASAQSATLANYASTLAARPVANAGSTQNVKVGSGTVTLDGSASSQTQGHPISYAWTPPVGVTLSSNTAQKPTFTAPNTPASYVFSLVVTDTQNAVTGNGTSGNTSTASTVTVNINDYASPVASAGSGQAVHTLDPVTLDATGSSQADGHTLSYLWAQTAGTPVTLTGGTTTHPHFTAPAAPSTLKFTVKVTDTQNPNPAAASTTSPEVTVTVGAFAAPTANAGPDQPHAASGSVVHLDGSGSSDPNHFTLTYTWTQVGGPHVTLSNIHAVKPTFTTTVDPSAISFQLQVNNGFFNGTSTDTVSINTDGIPGLDFTATDLTMKQGSLHGTKNTDTFTLTVKNTGTTFQSVDPAIVQATVLVNSTDVSSNVAVKSTKTVPLRPGQSAGMTFVWTHGATLHLGDAVVITGCVGYPGDYSPTNNCATLSYPAVPIVLAPSKVTIPPIAPTNSSNDITVQIKNSGTSQQSPILPSMVVVTLSVNGGTPSTLPTPAGKSVLLKPGKTHNYKFTWTHGSITHGHTVTVKACFVATGNTAANSCMVLTQTT